MAYNVYAGATAIDLTLVQNRRQILAPGNWVDALTVLRLPIGAQAFIHFGQQDGIPLLQEAPFIGFMRIEDANMGVFVSVPVAQPGVTIDLFIGYGDPLYDVKAGGGVSLRP